MQKLEVKLKQHTPLIHFQHNQEGATLRASEVKPKLDKYILDIISEEKRNQGISTGWVKRKNGKLWLDYKMRIVSTRFQDILIPVKPVRKRGELITDKTGQQLYTTDNYPDNTSSLVMSNIGGRTKEDIFNFSFARNVMMTIVVNNEILKDILDNHLVKFFGTNSFGNRTSKGFGSFEIESINGRETEGSIFSECYYISFTMLLGGDCNRSAAFKDIYKIISKLWKELKNLSDVRGKAERNVLLKVSPQKIQNADRIPSPILFKPLMDFYKEGDVCYCDVVICFVYDRKVIQQVTGSTETSYYKKKLLDLKEKISGNDNPYNYLSNIIDNEIDKNSISIEMI